MLTWLSRAFPSRDSTANLVRRRSDPARRPPALARRLDPFAIGLPPCHRKYRGLQAGRIRGDVSEGRAPEASLQIGSRSISWIDLTDGRGCRDGSVPPAGPRPVESL